MGGQLCHLVRGKEKGMHSCPRSLPGLYVQRSLLCPSASLTGADPPAVCSLDSPRGSVQGPQPPAQSPVLEVLVDLVETSLLGPLSFYPLWSLVVIFIQLNGPAHSRNVLETWKLPGHQLFSPSRPWQQPLQCSFQTHLFLMQSFSDGWLPPTSLACAPRCRKRPFLQTLMGWLLYPWHLGLPLQLRP